MAEVVLAYSGGLDTSWCVPHLTGQGHRVTTVTVDVGGFSASDIADLSGRSKSLGAVDHVHIHAKDQFFEDVLRFLIAGNVTKGGTYPLCVGAERTLQAKLVAEFALAQGASVVAHGCTAAGNDQFRFDLAFRCLAPGLQVLAPIRDEAPSREQQIADLLAAGYPVPSHGAAYSINNGLWGVTIGGSETTGTTKSIPESAWVRTKGAFDRTSKSSAIAIRFERGIPVGVNGETMDPVRCIESVDDIASAFGIGRGIHLGETILGIKGRVAFEAPAATVLLQAHRELEKLVLTKRQITIKESLGQQYGEMVHEGLALDPACRDIEAALVSSQLRVTGTVHVALQTGNSFVTGVESPYSLHAASRAVYGEAVGEWTTEDARGFAKVYGLSSVLAARSGAREEVSS